MQKRVAVWGILLVVLAGAGVLFYRYGNEIQEKHLQTKKVSLKTCKKHLSGCVLSLKNRPATA
ncbi:MAG: hypothetical protein LBO67_10325 [Spirochaetaceae bacterium]|nr:hypothetical protein [Spirochaetaceae bacterium]